MGNAQDSAMTPHCGRSGKYLTFRLGHEQYALPLTRVREIIAMIATTDVPLTPDYVRGVMNLRGKVIPVIDLRRKFAMAPSKDHERKCIIVVDVAQGESTVQMSVLVDEVCEVMFIADDTIQDVLLNAAGADLSFIDGIAKAQDGVKILLNVDAVLSAASPVAIARTAALSA